MDDSWSKDSPFRVPNWRWCRAIALADEQSIPRIADNDSEVVAAMRFYRKMLNNERVPKENKYAYSVYNDPNYARFKWEIEARLLAGQDDCTIASRMGMPDKSVACYESWFYNVRDRLDNISYIYQMLIYPVLNSEEPDKEAIWKLYAVIGGENVIDEIIYDGELMRNMNGQFWGMELLKTLTRRCAILARFGNKSDTSILSGLLRAYKELFTPIEKDEGTIADKLKSLVLAMKWDWSEDTKVDPGTMIGRASLKADELQMLAENSPNPDFVKMLESAQFPTKTD